MTYATDAELRLANSLGYRAKRSTQWGHRFECGCRRVWAISDGWQTADLVSERYRNHRVYLFRHQETLSDALKRPLARVS